MNEILTKPLYAVKERTTCGYFHDKEHEYCDIYLSSFMWNDFSEHLLNGNPATKGQFYTALLELGFIRQGSMFYQSQCGKCRQCVPIRIKVKDFEPSKRQKTNFRKNSDIQVRVETDRTQFVTDEKIKMLCEYYAYHNPNDPEPMQYDDAKACLADMNDGYNNSYQMEYRLNGKLIGVGIIDITQDDKYRDYALVSKYFFYDLSEETLKRSPGVFSVLKELEFCKKNKIKYYYLGLFIKDCQKMNYKAKYKPYELLLSSKWIPLAAEDTYIDTKHAFKFPNLRTKQEVKLITENIPLHLLYWGYRQGVFPWFDEDSGSPVLWQCPNDRYVIHPDKLHVPESLKKQMKKNLFTFTMDKEFRLVMEKCRSQARPDQFGTWIGKKMIEAYTNFHKAGYAHSIEAWQDGKLVGGFYGILIGSVFFGESMFTDISGSSKEAFVRFAEAFEKAGGKLIDCQMETENMARYKGENISRAEYLRELKNAIDVPLNGKLTLL